MPSKIFADKDFSIYAISDEFRTLVNRYIISTPETRSICNDPGIMGVQYTRMLESACKKVFTHISRLDRVHLKEAETIVFNVLRGGLNFGLREALADAYGWNCHGSSFISAQRARNSKDSEDWHIIESDYKKVYMPKVASIIVGDVVATGTSLQHALKALIQQADQNGCEIKHILFFTVGGKRAEELLHETDRICRERFSCFEGTHLFYVEGRFTVPDLATPLTIKLTGTDLVKLQAEMAPEFVESQYENPLYPLERCTIYDAGSRAFWLPDFIEDVCEYWKQNLELAKNGYSFEYLVKERCPFLDPDRYGNMNFKDLCQQQIKRFKR